MQRKEDLKKRQALYYQRKKLKMQDRRRIIKFLNDTQYIERFNKRFESKKRKQKRYFEKLIITYRPRKLIKFKEPRYYY